MKILYTLFTLAFIFTIVNCGRILSKLDRDKWRGNNYFQYKVHCIDDAKDTCNTIQNDLNYAFDSLRSTFEFYQPLIFEVYVIDLNKVGLDGNTIAAVSDINYIPLRTSNDINTPPYLYNQALVKQLNINKKVNYKKNDFIIYVNTSKEIMKVRKYLKRELSTILIHELLHALGFSTFGYLYQFRNNEILEIVDVNEDYRKTIYLPDYFIQHDLNKVKRFTSYDQLKRYNEKVKVVEFTPLTVFQKYIADISSKKLIFDKLGYLYRDFNCFEKEPLVEWTDRDYIRCYNKLSSETKEQLSSIAYDYYLSYKSMGILTKDEKIIPLQSFNDSYLSGSSISHINVKYIDVVRAMKKDDIPLPDELIYNDKSYLMYSEENMEKYVEGDFLMYFNSVNATNEMLYKTVARHNKHGLIGSGIVSILTTLGWTEKGERRSNDIYYVADDVNVPENVDFPLLLKKYELHGFEEEEESDESSTEEDKLFFSEVAEMEREEINNNSNQDNEREETNDNSNPDYERETSNYNKVENVENVNENDNTNEMDIYNDVYESYNPNIIENGHSESISYNENNYTPYNNNDENEYVSYINNENESILHTNNEYGPYNNNENEHISYTNNDNEL